MKLCHDSDLQSINAKLTKLIEIGEKIMSTIQDYVTTQQAFITGINTAITDITNEIATLNAAITNLQNGNLSADDQAALDSLSASVQKIEGSLQALDTANAPVPPVTGSTAK